MMGTHRTKQRRNEKGSLREYMDKSKVGNASDNVLVGLLAPRSFGKAEKLKRKVPQNSKGQ